MTVRRRSLILFAALLAAACEPEIATPVAEAAEPAPRAAPSFAALSNLAYPLAGVGSEGFALQLVDGVYTANANLPDQERLVATAELEPLHAIGDLDADGSPDGALVLGWSGGGSGTFYELFAVLNEPAGLRPLGGVLLGDRVELKSIAVRDGRVIVGYIGAGPDDAACCPTKRFDKAFQVEAGTLTEVALPGVSL